MAALIDIGEEFECMGDEGAGLGGIGDAALLGEGVEDGIADLDGDAAGVSVVIFAAVDVLVTLVFFAFFLATFLVCAMLIKGTNNNKKITFFIILRIIFWSSKLNYFKL